jgi:predicted dehydrogenase
MSKKPFPKDSSHSSNPQTKRVRWGVLGGARIARICMIPALNRSRNGEIWSLACRSEERSQSLAQEYEIPHACCRYEEVLENPEIEAVYEVFRP